MNKYFIITEHEYEGIMMTTDTVVCVREFSTKDSCVEEIEKIKSDNKKNFYKCKILKVIKGEKINIDE